MAEHRSEAQLLSALVDAVAAYEAEHGEITEAEMAAQVRRDRDAAAAVRVRARR